MSPKRRCGSCENTTGDTRITYDTLVLKGLSTLKKGLKRDTSAQSAILPLERRAEAAVSPQHATPSTCRPARDWTATTRAVCHGSRPSPRAPVKPMRLHARERERKKERKHNAVSYALRKRAATARARASPAGTFANQAALQVAAFTPQDNAAAEDRVRCGLAPKRRFADDGCNAPQVVVTPRANTAHGRRARPAG